jgi:polysaccharide export outer membrane protein
MIANSAALRAGLCHALIAGVLLCFHADCLAQVQKATGARKLGAGDSLTVMVFREQELTGEFKVSEQGSINYPLLGKIQVAGRTTEDVAKEIEQLLEKDYVRDAQVSVDVVGKGAIQISVLGEVRSPGRFPFEAEERVELGTALLVAGGATENSNLASIEIKRRNGDDIESIRASMPADKALVLRKDDSVIVAPRVAAGATRPLVTILGQVARPGAMEMPAGRDLDVLTAIALAGGMTPMARSSKVILRREGVEPVTINVAKIQKGEIESPILQGGDTLFVDEKIF